jgi:tetratricopeptide (TPR) repeat protein
MGVMLRRLALRAALTLTLASLPATLLRAEQGQVVVHLRNGATLTAVSVDEKGDDLVIHQAGGTVIVPRIEVARIERGTPGPATTGGPSNAGAQAGGAGGAPAAGPAPIPSRDEILRNIEVLDRRIRDFPLARQENTRQIVVLLDLLGYQAYQAKAFDEALGRFRQALGYDAHSARTQLGMAATYFAQGQDIYARSTLEQAVVDHPEDPEIRTLLGDVYDSQERPEDAVASWEKSYALRPNPAVQQRIDKLRREHSIDADYRLSQAAHFTLKYDGEMAGPDLGAEIIACLEEQFTSMITRFNFLPRQPIVVIVYPRLKFYEATQVEQNVGGLFDGKIRVPIGGLQQLNSEARKVLIHELTHAFIAGKSHGTAPRWLHEGLAQEAEGKTTSTQVGASLAKEYEALQGRGQWGQEFSYGSALSFVEFLIERYGFERLVEVLEAMGGGATADAAFQQATRDSLGDLREAWGQSLVGKYLK